MKKRPASLLIGAASLFGTAAVSFAGTGKSGKTEIIPPKEDIVVHPVTSPYFSEDSFITTDLRPVFAYHTFPGEVLGEQGFR